MKQGWEIKKLGEISRIIYGYTEKASSEEVGPKFLRITDIQNGTVNWESVPYCNISDTDFEKYKLIDGDIVFARTGATTGKSYLISTPPKAVFASYLIKVHINNRDVCYEFLNFFFHSKSYWEVINKGISGSAQGGFNATKLSSLEIPLPPLTEQQRIVSILDKVFAAIDKAKANAEQNLKNARDVFDSYLKGVFENPNDTWEIKFLSDIGKASMCKRIFKDQTSSNGGIPFFKIGTFGKEPDAFITNELYNSYRINYSFPEKGDILISASGTIGRRVIYNGQPAYFQDSNIVWIRNDEKYVLNGFLYYFYGVCNWRTTKGATIARLYNVNLKQIKISFPKSKIEQQSIVNKLDALRAETQKLEAIYKKKLDCLEELKKSVLQKAFTGELIEDV